jgi:hypothetical protein
MLEWPDGLTQLKIQLQFIDYLFIFIQNNIVLIYKKKLKLTNNLDKTHHLSL